MEIKKARLLKVTDGYGLDLTIDGVDKAGAVVNGSDKYRGLIHSDLKKAFDRLKIHLAMIPGLVPASAVEDIAAPNMDLFDKFFIHAFSVGGDEDTRGITLSGHWITYRGKALNYHTPFELFDTAPEARYVWMDDLQAALLDLKREIELYLGGKRGEAAKPKPVEKDPNQTELFDDGEVKAGEHTKRTKVQVLHPDVDNEINPGGAGTKLVEADADAQARVAEMGKGSKKANRRGARQTAADPGGKGGGEE